jgi:hypothetical protein
MRYATNSVTPTQVGAQTNIKTMIVADSTQRATLFLPWTRNWIPAFAGMTVGRRARDRSPNSVILGRAERAYRGPIDPLSLAPERVARWVLGTRARDDSGLRQSRHSTSAAQLHTG